jgi:hypothetical protein
VITSAALAAGAALPAAASAQTFPPRREVRCALATDGEVPVRLGWESTTSTGGCFFFAGPGDLGRDDSYGTSGRLGRTGERAWLVIGGFRFEGTLASGRLALSRRSDHDFSGTWRVDETIGGEVPTASGGVCPPIRMRYVYHECDTANPSGCPGRCTIESTIVVTP